MGSGEGGVRAQAGTKRHFMLPSPQSSRCGVTGPYAHAGPHAGFRPGLTGGSSSSRRRLPHCHGRIGNTASRELACAARAARQEPCPTCPPPPVMWHHLRTEWETPQKAGLPCIRCDENLVCPPVSPGPCNPGNQVGLWAGPEWVRPRVRRRCGQDRRLGTGSARERRRASARPLLGGQFPGRQGQGQVRSGTFLQNLRHVTFLGVKRSWPPGVTLGPRQACANV